MRCDCRNFFRAVIESEPRVIAQEPRRMTAPSIFLGGVRKQTSDRRVGGDLVTKDGVLCYRISSYDRMRPFFMSIVSSSDHWLFISSNGGLTAGRRNPDHALFPYYTDDKIHDSAEITGSRTILLVQCPEGWSSVAAIFGDRARCLPTGSKPVQERLRQSTFLRGGQSRSRPDV